MVERGFAVILVVVRLELGLLCEWESRLVLQRGSLAVHPVHWPNDDAGNGERVDGGQQSVVRALRIWRRASCERAGKGWAAVGRGRSWSHERRVGVAWAGGSQEKALETRASGVCSTFRGVTVFTRFRGVRPTSFTSAHSPPLSPNITERVRLGLRAPALEPAAGKVAERIARGVRSRRCGAPDVRCGRPSAKQVRRRLFVTFV